MKFKWFLGLAVLTFTASASTPDGFDPDKTREHLLNVLNTPQITELEISPVPAPGSPQEAFLKHYKEKIWPRSLEMSDLGQRYKALKLLKDSALYRSEKERAEWDEQIKQIIKRDSELSTDQQWTADLLEWGRLAKGLKGDLADAARRSAKAAELGQFPEAAKPWLNEIEQLDMKVDDYANDAPTKFAYLESQPKMAQLEADFHAGKISFTKAAKERAQLIRGGGLKFGKDVALSNGRHFKRIAELRTRLAKMKGFKTWAEYSLATQAQAHAERFKGIDAIRKFLTELLDETDQTMWAIMEKQSKKVARKPYREVHPFATSLLFAPAELRLRDFFPKENHVEVWKRTMLESGYSQSALDLITVDAFPRQGKQSHAYMMPLKTPEMKVLSVNGSNLNVLMPSEAGWYPAAINIVQNFTDDGMDDLRTMLHEGGHALDYIHRRDTVGFSPAYGYVETHSMTLEHFNQDVEFLLANGRKRDGQKLDRETITQFLTEVRIAELSSLRGQIFNALFDIELWDVDYTQRGTDLVSRAITVARNFRERLTGHPLPKDLQNEMGYLNFTTSHFYSGSVRYFGYIFAEVSSSMVAERLYDLLEKRTGRRSLYQQPEIASILINSLYRRGFAVPFPESIEAFTEKPFSPKEYARGLIEGLKGECGSKLSSTH